MQTIWLSPTNYVTGDPTLRVSYPFVSHPSTIVTCTTPGDYKWVSMGLRLPPNGQLEEVIICYEVSNVRSFISQTRLAEMTTPDHATVVHDDPTHLTSTTPASYNSAVSGLIPTGAVTLELRLNFQNASDEIILGAVGLTTAISSGGQATDTLTNGLNSNIATHGVPTLRFSGPSAAFSIGGFSPPIGAPVAGMPLMVINTTSQSMTIVNSDANSAYKIDTQSGASVTLAPRKSTASFLFDGATNKWILQNPGLVYPVELSVRDFGAQVDGQTVSDGSIDSGTTSLRSATANWTPSDVGKLIVVQFGGPSGAPLATTIASVTNPGVCTLDASASTTTKGSRVDWGTDDTSAIQSAIAAAATSGSYSTIVRLGVGTSLISKPIVVDYSAGVVNLTLCGYGYLYQGAQNYSRLAMAASNRRQTLDIKSLALHLHDMWIDGNNLATYPMELEGNAPPVETLTSDFDAYRFMVSGAVVDAGVEVFINGNSEVDNVSFRRFQFWHDPRNSGGPLKSAANFQITRNSQAFNINLEHGSMYGGAWGVKLDTGGANVKHCQIFNNTVGLISYEAIQDSCFDDIYTEQQEGIPFLVEGNRFADNGFAPILVKNCIMNSANDIVTGCKQTLILQANRLGGNVRIEPAKPPAGGGPIGIFHVIDLGTNFANLDKGFTGDLTKLEQIGTTSWTHPGPNGYFTAAPEVTANSTHLTRVARSLQGSESFAPRVLDGSGTASAITFMVDSLEPNSWIVNKAIGGASITLPPPTLGRSIRFQDATGAASTGAAITLHPNASETINGTSRYSMTTNYGAVTAYCFDGTNWIVAP
jgi:hypothetical protein